MRSDRLASVMRRIAAGKLDRAAAADALGVSERHVNRLMEQYGVKRPRGQATTRKLEARLRREAKERAARAVLAGAKTPEEARLQTGASLRTVYRWVARLKKRKIAVSKRAKKQQNGPKNQRKTRK